MKDDRLKVPVDPAYLTAIGMAAYSFARLEWDAVYCGEKLNPGYVNTVAAETAGQIARKVLSFAYMIVDQNKKARFQTAANEFLRLSQRRNDLLHSNPAKVDGEQRLVRHGTPWLPNEIEDLADEFTACSMKLNELHRNVL